MEKVKLNTIEEAIADFKSGEFVVVVDDEDRENEGDLIIAAEKVTPEKVNFMNWPNRKRVTISCRMRLKILAIS